jgi:hypothetical protein
MEQLYPAGRDLVPVLKLASRYRDEANSAFANGSSVTAGVARQFDGTLLHYVRGIPTITPEQAYGYPTRLSSNRYNPYIRPGGLTDLYSGYGYKSFNCSHVSKDGGRFAFSGRSPPCLEQPPWEFDGEKRSYPHVERQPDTVGR